MEVLETRRRGGGRIAGVGGGASTISVSTVGGILCCRGDVVVAGRSNRGVESGGLHTGYRTMP